nr:hypothetical protein [Streptococcus parasuis]
MALVPSVFGAVLLVAIFSSSRRS